MTVPNTAAQRLIEALSNAGCRPRSNGEQKWSALCPGHDDSSPSLSIRATDDRVLVHCFAGCDVDTVLAPLGWTRSDLFDEVKQVSWGANSGRKTWFPSRKPLMPICRPRPVALVDPEPRDVLNDLATAVCRGEQVLLTDDYAVAFDYGDVMTLLTDRWREYPEVAHLLCDANVVIAVQDPVEAAALTAWLIPVARSIDVLA